MTPTGIKPADRNFALYLCGFVTAWVLYVVFVYPHVRALGEASFAYAAAGIGIRLLLWILPVFLMLRSLDHADAMRTLGLIDNWKRGVLIGIGLALLLLSVEFIRLGQPHDVGRYLTWNNILGPSLGAGLFEEIPFRGFILQKLNTRMSFWLANVCTSFVFVGLHLPGWFILNLFKPQTALQVFVFSLAMGAIFHYSRSLWGCVISHSANDCIAVVLFHGR